MQGSREAVLSIAGFDPCGGAGVLADIKAFEQIGVYGCGITTSITYQNDIHFEGLHWLPFPEIEKQFKPLAERFLFHYVKIGLIENLEVLQQCIDMLKNHNPEIKIIWDPILKASAGFEFHSDFDKLRLNELLESLYLVTPNREEIFKLNPGKNDETGAEDLAEFCNVLLKGGHADDAEAADILFLKGNKGKHIFYGKREENISKHGSGCVLSAVLSGFMQKTGSLLESCSLAKDYTFQFLKSAEGRLGFHHTIETMKNELAE